MTSTTRRLLLLALPLITACATELVTYDGAYAWIKDPTTSACADYTWLRVEAHRAPGLCSGGGQMATESTSCAFAAPSCLVISPYTADQAKRIRVGSMSLYEHELRHLSGYVHP